jgi:hypothetical protein
MAGGSHADRPCRNIARLLLLLLSWQQTVTFQRIVIIEVSPFCVELLVSS